MRISSSVSISLTNFVSTRSPSLNTVTRSPISNTSSSLWEMKIIVFPFSIRFLTIWKSFSTSFLARADVGSSSIISSGSWSSILMISTICCCATVSLQTMASRSIVMPYCSITVSACLRIFLRSTTPNLTGSIFRKRFSSTVISPTSVNSWKTIAIPISWDCLGVLIFTFSPFRQISPLSASNSPASIFRMVLLPAPFSPASTCTSPLLQAKSTSVSALQPPKLL